MLPTASCAFRKRRAQVCAGKRLERSSRIRAGDRTVGPATTFFSGLYRDVQDFAAGAGPDRHPADPGGAPGHLPAERESARNAAGRIGRRFHITLLPAAIRGPRLLAEPG